MQLLIGAGNEGKVQFVASLLKGLPVECVAPQTLGIRLSVEETGDTVQANARIKAEAYCAASGLPTLSSDAGLTIDGLTEEQQPGLYVRRVSKGEDATDDEVLDHFRALIAEIGGSTTAQWEASAVLATPFKTVTTSFGRETWLTSDACQVRTPGAPLQSMQFDRESDKYLAQMSEEERRAYYRRSRGFFEFVEEHLSLIRKSSQA